ALGAVRQAAHHRPADRRVRLVGVDQPGDHSVIHPPSLDKAAPLPSATWPPRTFDSLGQRASGSGLMTSSHGPSRFRPDIEGMRAIAILLVLLYHAGVPGFGGGFIGVDVFFVLSGYLITRSLLEEAGRSGTIHLREFYARRARRLLPAALLVLIVTAGAVWLVLPLTAWREFGSE